MSGIFYHFTRGESISRGDKSHNGTNRRASSPNERPALRSTATANAAAATSPSSSPRQARARGMLRKMKAKVGEAISPRERNEIARTAVSSSPAEGYNLELYFATPSPSSSSEVESVPDACHSGMKRRPSVTIMEEWNEYYHDADGTSGPRGNYASEEEGTEKKKVDPTSALEAAQAEAQHGGEERGGEEYEEYGDGDDDENWEEGYIMVDVGSEKEVATRLPGTNGDDCTVGGEETRGEPSVSTSTSVPVAATPEENDGKNGTNETPTTTKTVLATNTSTDGEDEGDDDDDDEDCDVSDSSTEWDATTTPEEGEPAVTTAKSKPRFQLRIPQRKDPALSPQAEATSHPHSGSLSAGRDYKSSADMGSLGFLTPSPLRKQQARNSFSPRSEHMAGGRKALSALSLMASMAPIGHASFCSDLDTARKVLMSPKLQLVTQLSKRVDPADYNTIAQTLVKIFEANGKAMDLLEWAIRQEISSSLDQHTVLREDSLWNQIIAQDFTLIGGNYLRQLLRTEVTKIIRSPSTSDKKVAESASLLLKEICSSLSYCPSQISSVCYILHKELSKHFPTGRGHGSVIGSFYMLRFICPALVSPVKMGFVDSQQNNNLPVEVMRHLVAVAKLLQSLANTSMQASFLQPQHQHASAAEKERSMRWEKFLRTKIPLYHEFIAGLTSESLFLKSTTASSQHYNQAGAAMTNTISGLRLRANTVTMEEEAIALSTLQHFVSAMKNKPLESASGSRTLCKCVSVPERFSLVFSKAERLVVDYFDGINRNTNQGIISTVEQVDTSTSPRTETEPTKPGPQSLSHRAKDRYILLRGDSLSVGFYMQLKKTFGFSAGECHEFLGHLLYDIMQGTGRSDCKQFKSMTGMDATFFNLAADSRISERDDNFLVACHNAFSFEAEAWSKSQKRPTQPVCAMNAGYIAGWCQESYGLELVAKEILCKGKGDACCQFIICPPHKLKEHVKRFGDMAKEERMGTVERDRERTEESQVSPKSISNKVNFRDDILSPRFLISPRGGMVNCSPILRDEMKLSGEGLAQQKNNFDSMAYLRKMRTRRAISSRQRKAKTKSAKTRKARIGLDSVGMEEAPEGATDQWRSEALEIRFHEHYSEMKRLPSTGEITLNEDRYVLVRAKAMVTEFHALVRDVFAPRANKAAFEFASNALFDLGRGLGSADLTNFVEGPHALGPSRNVAECHVGFRAHCTHTGWGKVVIHEMSNIAAANAHDYYMIYDLYHSVEAEAWAAESEPPAGSGGGPNGGAHHHAKEKLRTQTVNKGSSVSTTPATPTCYLAAGYGSGWFSELWGQSMAAVEVACVATGQGECCRFVVAPPHRILHYLRFLGAALDQPMATLAALPMLHLFAQDKDGERCAWGQSFDSSAVSHSQ